MNDTGRIERIIAPTITALGFEIVRVQLSGGQRPVLQVMAERVDRLPMTVEDCADISRAVSALLDVEDPIAGAYTLEVSSPGIDRPLTRLGDFERYAGYEVRIETRQPVNGRRRFQGMLRGTDDGQVRVDLSEGTALLPFADIQRAKLVLNDALIAASARPDPSGEPQPRP
ncbi:MAG: ribosome maturation factor RimP [Azospirillum sp.]|nr:ribosome maturation factor RimP [Azospirillum sp.]